MILVDNRVGSKDLLSMLAALSVPVGSATLMYGDVSFNGNGPDGRPVPVGIETKTIQDVLACMRNGRFSGTQLPGLHESYEVAWLVVEGVYRASGADLEVFRGKALEAEADKGFGYWLPLRWSGADFDALEHWLMTMEVRGRIKVRTSPYRSWTARWIAALYRWWTEKRYEQHRSHLMLDKSGDASEIVRFGDYPMARVIETLVEGIGRSRALTIGMRFGKLSEMREATEKDWLALPGIGKGLSKRIMEAVRA